MNKLTRPFIAALLLLSPIAVSAETWTLQQCIDYATAHSIDLQKSHISEQDYEQQLDQAKAQLLPTLSASTSQNINNRPWAKSTNNVITDGSGNMTVASSSSSTTYNGNYGLNLGYTLWNGGRRTKTIEQTRLNLEKQQLSTEQQLNSLKEQIVQAYIDILYAREAIAINEGTLNVAKAQRDRAAQMVKIGTLSKADLSQLEAQVAQDEYNVVNAKVSVARNILKLKQLLELEPAADFDVATIAVSDEQALGIIPNADEVYQVALAARPEIRGSKLSVDIADKQIEIARAGRLPSVSISAGIGTSNMSGAGKGLFDQWKQNWSNSAGLNVSVPIFSQHQNKVAINRAQLQKQTAELEVLNQQKQLRNTIDGYWLDAQNAQAQFRSADANVTSMQTSFDLLSEQFNVGLKNLVELMDGKNNLQKAQQSKLQSKYTSILDQQLLKYYAGEDFKL